MSGLPLADTYGVPAAAIATMEARMALQCLELADDDETRRRIEALNEALRIAIQARSVVPLQELFDAALGGSSASR